MQPFIAAKREEIVDLCRTYHVRRLAIFGSALRTDFNATSSDVDVVVEFDDMPIEFYADNKFALEDALSATFNRKVDLVTWKSLSNPYLLREVQDTQEPLYAA